MPVHQFDKLLIVAPLDQVNEFVDDNVFKTLTRLFCQLRIQPDAPGVGIAATPFGPHVLNIESRTAYSDSLLPLIQ
jgi:hypothetical protein